MTRTEDFYSENAKPLIPFLLQGINSMIVTYGTSKYVFLL